MSEFKKYKQLLRHMNNLPLHLQLSIVSFLDNQTKYRIQQYGKTGNYLKEPFFSLVSLSLVCEKYITSTDRSVYLSFYNEPAFAKYQSNLIAEISTKEPQRYFNIQKSISQVFENMKMEMKCFESAQSLIQLIDLQIRDPELPLPRMRKQGIAMHCNSQLQYALVDLKFDGANNQGQQFVEDCILDLEQLIECLQQTLQQVLEQRIKQSQESKSPICIMKQIYYHPEILTIQNYRNYFIKSLMPFNIFVCLHALLNGIAQIYHEYIIDQDKQFQRFIEFQMRFCIFRAIICAFQSSKISKILYSAVQKLIQKGQQIAQRISESQKNKIEQQTIIQASLQLQNKPSQQEQIQITQKVMSKGLLRMPSEVKTQRTQIQNHGDFQMSSRLYLIGSKIWSNQNKKIKTINEQNPSPSKFLSGIPQDQINAKSYIKILNRLSYLNIQDRVQKQIDENAQLWNTNKIQQISISPIRDEDIINIFGANAQNSQLDSPTLHYSQSITVSQSSSQSPKSPQNSPSSTFSSMMRSLGKVQQISNYGTSLINVLNKIRLEPYRFEKNSGMNIAHEFTHSPQKQLQIMPQIGFQNLSKMPSMRFANRLHSKASIISKFTKITQAKAISSVEQLIQDDTGIQQQILLQYNSYLTDLSVNEINVHWCGHTEQAMMGDHFHQIQQYILKYNQGFILYLLMLGEEVCQKIQSEKRNTADIRSSPVKVSSNMNKVLKNLLHWHLLYLDTGFMPKKIVKKILAIANDLLVKVCRRHKISEQQVQIVTLNLDESDKMIEHYNQQMWKIQKNVSQQKLKVYQERKNVRSRIELLKCNQHDRHKHEAKKGERKRRNSQKALILHSKE